MAVIRNTSSQRRVGRVGSDTFYVANGQQIVRQAQNNSNYGESASRSEAQQKRRVRWANLVTLYKASKEWMPKAFETKAGNQSDYNKFMSLNVNNTEVCLTKDMAANGCSVIETIIVSQGSLSPISLTDNTPYISTNLRVGSLVIGDDTSIADLAEAIIANNSGWKSGDGISFVIYHGRKWRNGYPYTFTEYDEIKLDVNNHSSLNTQENMVFFRVNSEMLDLHDILYSNDAQWGIVAIHTRKEGKLFVSTQQLEVGDFAFSQEFSSKPWERACMLSYGINEDVVLTPEGAISMLTAYAIDDYSDEKPFVGHFHEQSVTANTVYLRITNYDSVSCYAMLGSDKIPFDHDNGFRTFDLVESGDYKIYINKQEVGVITAISS